MLNIAPHDSILEPCGGDGVFVDKILEYAPLSNIDVFELNPNSFSFLTQKYSSKPNVQIKLTDTLLDKDIIKHHKLYDKIIGNPPYGARNDAKKKDALNSLYAGLYTKESYTLFLYACIQCLKENGELSFIIPDTFLSLHRHLAIRQYLLINTKIKEVALFPSSFFPGINFGYANLCIITLTKSSDTKQNLENSITLRTGFNTVEELCHAERGYTKNISQRSVYENVGSAFMFNSSKELAKLINDKSILKIGDIADCVTGFYSGNDKKYLHPIDSNLKNAKKYSTVPFVDLRLTPLTEKEKCQGIDGQQHFVPIVKGGNISYVKSNSWFMDWSIQAIKEYKDSKKCRFQNSTFYFKEGIAIPMIRSSKLTGALIGGRLFDQSIVGVFPHDETWTNYLLGFFNSDVCTKLIEAINPSTNNSANYIKKIPFIKPDKTTKENVESLVKNIVSNIKTGNLQCLSLENRLNEIFDGLYLHKIGVDRQQHHKISYKQLDLFEQYERLSVAF